MAGSLGPKPRMPGAAGAVQTPGLAFYDGPTGAMQPGSFPGPGAVGAPVQPPQPQQPQPQTWAGAAPGQAPVGGSMQPVGGSMQPVGGSMQPGHFPPPQQPGYFPPPQPAGYDDVENEPPLLEELGINVDHILLRIKGVAFFKQVEQEVLEDLDLSGPLVIILGLSTCLLLAGKITFSYVYGFGVSGCVLIWMLINLMSQKGGIDMYRTASVLGYGLIPVVIMAFLGIFVSLQTSFGSIIAGVCIAWSTATASRFFATANAMDQQRWLVAYPVGLFYTCFSLLTVF